MPTRLRLTSILTASLAGIALVISPLLLGSCIGSTQTEQPTPDQQLQQRIDTARRDARQRPDEVAAQLEWAKLLHLQGSLGNEDAAKQADRLLQQLHQAHPDHPRVKAYAAAATMMRAERTFLPWKKGKLVKKGGKMIERAMELAEQTPAQDQLEVRYVRALSAASLPPWMEQGEIARREFAELAQVAEEAASNGELSPQQAARVLLHHATALHDRGDPKAAKRALRKAVDLSPDSHAGAEARRMLNEM